MKLETLITDSIRAASANVFSTMLGQELPQGELSLENGTPKANDGVVSFIGIAGTWAGTGSITCSPALACRICSQMLLMDAMAVDAEVLDAVAELTNMIIGGVKTDLETYLGPLGLSLPTVVFGRNFRTRSSGPQEWIVLTFMWEAEPLTVKMCLAPNERTATPHHTGAPLYAVEV
jgi:CheY-specific phosphatase CheX